MITLYLRLAYVQHAQQNNLFEHAQFFGAVQSSCLHRPAGACLSTA